jgi:hypothetical protein
MSLDNVHDCNVFGDLYTGDRSGGAYALTIYLEWAAVVLLF